MEAALSTRRLRPLLTLAVLGLALAPAAAAASDLILPGWGPDGPSIPFNVLGFRQENRETRPRHRGYDYTSYPECAVVTDHIITGLGNTLDRHLGCGPYGVAARP